MPIARHCGNVTITRRAQGYSNRRMTVNDAGRTVAQLFSGSALSWTLQWLIATTVVLGGAICAVRFLATVSQGVTPSTATPKQRRQTYEDLSRESEGLTSCETSDFLLGMARDLYELKHRAYDTLDDKAQKLIALIGGGASLFALLAGVTGGEHTAITPLLGLSATCFFLSLIVLLLSLRPRETDIPTITEFNSRAVLSEPASRARIGRRMIEAWQEITLSLTPLLRTKGRLIFVATILIVVGASLLLTNSLVTLTDTTNHVSRLKCSGFASKKDTAIITCSDLLK